MTVPDWPTELQPSSMKIWISTGAFVTPSQRNEAISTAWASPGQCWRIDYTFNVLSAINKRIAQGFLAYLNGPASVVNLIDADYDYDTSTRLIGGHASGAIKATGSKDASQINLSSVGGSSPSFGIGDRIGIAGNVYEIGAQADQVAGNITGLEIRPFLRADAALAAVSLTGLKFQMRLIDTKQAMAAINYFGKGEGFTLSFTESLL